MSGGSEAMTFETVPVGEPAESNSDRSRDVLEVRDLTVDFGGVRALDTVSLRVPAGRCCGIIGPNGAGKTTLFDTISGLQRPTRGRVIFDGRDVTAQSALWRARHGMRRTYQRQQVFPSLSVEDNVIVALEWHGGGGGFWADLVKAPVRRRIERQRRIRVTEVLELCGLSDSKEVPAHTLTIGKARMLELARALVDPPKLLLIDEPTAGMEHGQVERLGEILIELRAETQCGIILIEHDVGFIMRHSDRIVVLNLGRVIAEGTAAEIQAHRAVREAYLG
jgi:ABC-type branched-subunit amino acid transport system ATPase component